MLLLRPLNFNDIQGLERLAVISGGSMTTLPANRDHLGELINGTQQSLRKDVEQAGDESYHFVLEDTESGSLIGVSGIDATVGISSPFYSYRTEKVVHASNELQIHNQIPALHLCQDYTGVARLCTLFIDKEHRTPVNLHLLSRARLMFIAQHPERFASRLIAELQGVVDENNRSPFWESLGRHFFEMDFTKANYLTGINSKGFIADLMPHYPVYVPLLSQEAQDVLGKPRPDMQNVMRLLENEGFSYRGYIDIFDAGPTMEARTDFVRSIAQNRQVAARIGESATDDSNLHQALISNTGLKNYRCLVSRIDPEQPEISAEIAELLQVSEGDPIRIMRLSDAELG
ncbi:arginine N-succinyltransferase [Amphritea balenae]|uniref:Arginine N-succinyltransferase n=1 Tax=Amphritea balenae TaxID=452629 RepID=A0A3P1SX19_9GAMM|nr:arginine N-succinyltransferase [Amphritea balenae]RRD01751.1 arginine N-succinyltransferase [Amphritea balenae]GGK54357.1 arginine N-succinyltransferase [Amphritea balenae]